MSTALPPQAPQPYASQPPSSGGPTKGSGLAITALVLGIFSVLICLIPILNNFAYVTALLGLIFGVIAFLGARRGKRTGKGMATAGIILSVLAIIGAILSTIVFVKALDGVSKELDKAAGAVTASPSVASSSTTTDDTAPAEEAEEEPATPQVYGVGDVVDLTAGGEAAGTVKLNSVSVFKESPGDFSEKPENGRFKVINVTIVNTGSDTYDVNSFDFYFQDKEGNKYEYGDGNSIMTDFKGSDFGSTTLNKKGTKRTGNIVFDVPSNATELVYAPAFDGQPVATWKTK